MSHSPEPWKLDSTLRGIMASDESAVCYDIPEDDDDDAGTILAPNKANAERIVACVNYCKGIDTSDLIRVATDMPNNPRRVIACINAMKDVPDPAAFVEAVKEFIRDHYGSPLRDGPDTMIARNFARFIDMELPT